MRSSAISMAVLLVMATCLAGCLGNSDSNSDRVIETSIVDYCSVDQPREQYDVDGDGLSDQCEETLATDPYHPDTDLDSAPDGWEYENGFDPLNSSDQAGLVFCVWSEGFWTEEQDCDYERPNDDPEEREDDSEDSEDDSNVMNQENCENRGGTWIEDRRHCSFDEREENNSRDDDREENSSEMTQQDCERRGGTWHEERNECSFESDREDNYSEITQEECELDGGSWSESPDREGEYYCDMSSEEGLEENQTNSTEDNPLGNSTESNDNTTSNDLDNSTDDQAGNETGNSTEDNTNKTYNVLYIGHSFGQPFAQQMEEFAALAGIEHNQIIEFSGGASGAPDRLWEDDGHRENIKTILDGGNIDVLIMICCSASFIDSNGVDDDQAVWNFTEYALQQNNQTRIGLAMPWSDFPQAFDDAEDHRNRTDMAYPLWEQMASRLSSDFDGADVFTFYHGAAMYELRELFEAGNLTDIDQLRGPKATSLFTDQKGHAGQILIDTGSLIWLAAIHGVNPMDLPEFEEYELDIRALAKSILDSYSQ